MKRLLLPVALVALLAATGCPSTSGYSQLSQALQDDGVVVWCHDLNGKACQAAADTVGLTPVDSQGVPDHLLRGLQDLPDDCADPGVREIMGKVGSALGHAPKNWHDNVGDSITRANIDKTYAGGGCTNCCWDSNEPPIKVHVLTSPQSPRYLLRVWEFAQ